MSKTVSGVKFDANAIREKVEEMNNGKKKGKNENFRFKRQNGDIVRYISWPDGDLVKEMFFHFKVGKRMFSVCPRSVGDKCRICEEGFNLLNLAKTKDKEEADAIKSQARKLISVQYAAIPVMARNRQLDKKVMIDTLSVPFSKNSTKENEYKKFLDWLSDPDVGNITDPTTGRDVKLTSREAGVGKNKYQIWTMELRPSVTPLAGSEADATEVLDAVPKFDEVYTVMTYEDSAKVYNDMMHEVDFPPEPPPEDLDPDDADVADSTNPAQ